MPDRESPGSSPAPAANSQPNINWDPGLPRDLTYIGIVVGCFLAVGGVLMMYYMSRIPHPLPGLAVCVGFGIVLAALGARAAGKWHGFALTGSAVLSVVLYSILMYQMPKQELAFIKEGTIVGNFTNVASVRLQDGPSLLYGYIARDYESHNFVFTSSTLRSNVLEVILDLTKDAGGGAGGKPIRMQADAGMIKKKYLDNDEVRFIRWVYSVEKQIIRDGSEVIFSVQENLDPDTLMIPKTGWLDWFKLPHFISSAIGAENIGAVIEGLRSEDTATRRNTRDRLIAIGPDAVPPMMTALQKAPDDYVLKAGVIFSLLEILRSNDTQSQRREISSKLTADDIGILARAVGDSDKTVRAQASEILYRLRDHRTINAALKTIEEFAGKPRGDDADAQNAIYNLVVALQPSFSDLSSSEQESALSKLNAVVPSNFEKSRQLISSLNAADTIIIQLATYRASNCSTAQAEASEYKGYFTPVPTLWRVLPSQLIVVGIRAATRDQAVSLRDKAWAMASDPHFSKNDLANAQIRFNPGWQPLSSCP